MMYGDNPFDLHTGTVGVSIPVYTYNDRDFTLPITLNYSSNGFKPNKQSDIAGYDWHLNVGGTITREKRGMPDEKKQVYENLTPQHGYMYYHDLPDTLGCVITPRHFDQDKPVTLFRNKKSVDYDMEPDIFHFSFMGYTGTFQLGPMGEFYVYDSNCPAGEIVIKQFEPGNHDEYLTISVVTGDGFEYVFGGDEYSVDYADNDEDGEYQAMGPEQYDKIGSKTMPVAWHLKEVIAPNDRKIVFSYNRRRNIISHFIPKYMMSYDEYSHGPWSIGISYTNSAQLGSIEIGAWRAEFVYRKRKSNEIERANETATVFSSDLLTNINITCNREGTPDTLKTCRMSYTRPCKMLLDSVIISGEGAYHMNYYGSSTTAPKIDTYAIDHWGYWNDRAKRDTFIPIAENGGWNWDWDKPLSAYDSNPDIIFSNSRDPNAEKTKWGMLTDITYPTGGRSHFEYEGHDYGWVVKHQPTKNTWLDDYSLSLMEDEPGIAGGLRIKSVQNYDRDNTLLSSKQYSYNYDPVDLGPAERTGILLKYPRYRISIPYLNGPSQNWYFYLKSDWDIYTYDKSDVEYMSVLESNSDGSSIQYEYSTWMTDCDLNEYEQYTEFQPGTWYQQGIDPTWKKGVHNLLKRPNSHHGERGRLLKKTSNNIPYDMMQTEYRIYNYRNLRSVQSPMYTSIDGCYKHKEYIENFTLDSVVYEYEFKPIKTIAYRYNNAKQLAREINYESDGSIRTLYNIYLRDKTNYSSFVEQEMHKNNFVRQPLQTYTTVKNSENEYIVEYNKNYFTSFLDMILLVKTDKAHIPDNTPLSDKDFLSYTSDIACLEFDLYGNVTQTVNKAGTRTAYLWSPDGLYLEAVINNATTDDIKSAFSTLTTQEKNAGLTTKKEELLRQIPGVMVTTYKYKPYVGLSEITDPAGVKTVYTYTPSGKLAAEYDGKGNILRSYEYSTDKK